MSVYIYIWAAEVIWYKTQLTGCSYLDLQSRHVLGGLPSFSNAELVFNSQMLHVRFLPRSRGVPTSFYRLIMIFLTNRGTPQYYSLFNQIKSVAHINQIKSVAHIYIYIHILYTYIIREHHWTCQYLHGGCWQVAINKTTNRTAWSGLTKNSGWPS